MERLISLKTQFSDKELVDIVDKLSTQYHVLLRVYIGDYNHMNAFVSFDKKNYINIPIDYTVNEGFIVNPFIQIEEYLKNVRQ